MSETDRVVLVVIDGLGIAPDGPGNAFAQANTPVLDELFTTRPYTELDASGPAVGLPDGYIGNSEVGHLHIGAGRIIPQNLQRINAAIDTGSFFENDALQDADDYAAAHTGTVHVMGIVSDGGVHGHIDHMKATIRFFAERGQDVIVHAFLDGRDVEPTSATQYLEELEAFATEQGTGHVGSVMGRYYAMDRDQNWDRTKDAYRALTQGDGRHAADIAACMATAYEYDRNDYFVSPTLIDETFAPVRDGDVVIFTNYRKDRARQLTAAFTRPDFDHFARDDRELYFVTMLPYRDDYDLPVLFDELTVTDTVGEVLSTAGMTQLRVTESQKEPHVTYFFDGQRETPFDGVNTTIFKSAAVPSYDQKPGMEADKITDATVTAMKQDAPNLILVNYPNCDLVGHTGDIGAAITAIETVDRSIGVLQDAAETMDYTLLVTADHGNCERMREGEKTVTAHTLNPVPFCIAVGPDKPLSRGGLANIAPTILALLDVTPPAAMTSNLFA